MFSAKTYTQELITRQSDSIQSLTFAHGGESLVAASYQGILGIDLLSYLDGRMQVSLAAFTEPTEVWFSDSGNVAYINTGSTISTLMITR